MILGKLDLKEGMTLDSVAEFIDIAKKQEQDVIREAKTLFEAHMKGLTTQ